MYITIAAAAALEKCVPSRKPRRKLKGKGQNYLEASHNFDFVSFKTTNVAKERVSCDVNRNVYVDSGGKNKWDANSAEISRVIGSGESQKACLDKVIAKCASKLDWRFDVDQDSCDFRNDVEVVRIGGDILGVSNCSSNVQNDKLGVGVVHGIPFLQRDHRERERDATQSQGSGSCVINSNSGGAGSGSVILGSNVTTSSPSESSFGVSNKSLERPGKGISSHKSSPGGHSKINKRRKVNLAEVDDLIHLSGPLTEDAIIRCIQARVAAGRCSVYMGPILLMTNRLTSTNDPLTLASTADCPIASDLKKIVVETLRQQADTGYPQALILSGVSGAGKTHTSMLIVRQLFLLAGGGVSSDAFRHLSASVTVLRSLGTATTVLNRNSSRVGHFIEVQVTEGTVYRTKVHCYFLDQTRVVKTPVDEKNYDIFYQMLAGLSHEERERLHLGHHTVETLRYLNRADCRTDEKEDKRRFLDWKTSLGLLGIPFLDVVRVLAAVILMGNVQFRESSSSCMEMDIKGESELQSAAALLGVSESALKQGLTMRTHNARNQLVRSRVDANSCNFSRDSLAKSLYTRTVATIVRRANSLKRLGSNSGTLSSDSADSVHNQAEVASQHASTVGTAGSKASKSMTALNNAVRQTTDGFIGILDMFGFEDVRPSHLEQLCINLCAETMQHFYSTHIFKASIESCRDEGIQSDWEVEYLDNVPCIDLISSLRTGLLSMLDVECSARGTVESYVEKVTSVHKTNSRLVPIDRSAAVTDLRSFSVQHYAGKVVYNCTEFLDTNRDILADDLVAVFHKHRCSFGFASHLFSSELKILGAGGMEPSPRGISFRISPTSHTELLNGDEPVSTLTQDFHTRLDNLLRTLVHAKPHFIRCIKINQSEQSDLFDRHVVSKQLRAFQVLETVNLMANGYPHRMRFKAFNARYKLLGPFHQLSRSEERILEDCQLILDCFDNSVASCHARDRRNISISWAVGKRHIFLSEGARQQLESFRSSARTRAATLIQSTWRGFHCRRRWPMLRQSFQHHQHHRHYPAEEDLPPSLPPPNPHQFSNGSHFTTQPFGHSTTLPRQHCPSNGMGPPPVPQTSYPVKPYHQQVTTTNNLYPGYSAASTLRHSSLISAPPPQSSQSLPHLQRTQPLLSPSTTTLPVPVPRREASTSNPEMHHNNHPKNLPSSGSVSVTSSLSPPILPPITPTNGHTIATATTVATNGGTQSLCSSSNHSNNSSGARPPRPQPISGTPPPQEQQERCDPKLVQQTCSMFGLDMERPPPLPPSRSYTVTGNTKLGYPQTRVMKMTYPDEGTPSDIRLLKGDSVTVIGTSPRRGHLMVEVKNRTLHVPFQYLELKTTSEP
ncbi:unconventional myosin-Ib isoform X3 [Folsomia candida]|uniref:unconventional myosin-Ib isoform X3 n=1 Tax=Folsomia candida TaxID=158441 RepID=UPI001604C637|nr:unconventional myosin-Ib isoform X3 [Folsomia candida]